MLSVNRKEFDAFGGGPPQGLRAMLSCVCAYLIPKPKLVLFFSFLAFSAFLYLCPVGCQGLRHLSACSSTTPSPRLRGTSRRALSSTEPPDRLDRYACGPLICSCLMHLFSSCRGQLGRYLGLRPLTCSYSVAFPAVLECTTICCGPSSCAMPFLRSQVPVRTLVVHMGPLVGL